MCDLGEDKKDSCVNTEEKVFFKQEEQKNVGQKIKTEFSDDEETGQIMNKQIFPPPEVKVEEGEAVNGCDQMCNLNYTDWKLKNEVLDIKEDESKTNENSVVKHQDCRRHIHRQYHNRVGPNDIENESVLFQQRNLDEHRLQKSPAKLKFKCTQCAYQNKHKSHFSIHILKHKDPGEINMFKCDQCDYQTKYKSNVGKHLLLHKDLGEVDMFKCMQCDYRSIQKSHVKEHLLVHTDPEEVYLFKCGQCDYQSKSKSNLHKHLRRHKDPGEVNMFKCDQCDYQSIQKSNLKKHILRHMNPGEVDMFKCDQCAFQTKYKSNLRMHLLRHNDPE